MRRSHSSAVPIAAAATLAALVACAPAGDGPDATGDITLAGPIIASYDPLNGAHLFFTTGQAVYDPLIMVPMEGLEPQPWLAESFEISEDGYTISFKLREDVDFVDGTHFDAPGLERYFDALFASEGFIWKPRVVDQFGAEATATGEYTLDIRMSKQPVSYQWLWQFSLTPIASPAVVDDPSLLEDGPVGSGPYLIRETIPDVSISYERNDEYWNPDAYPYDEVTIAAYADQVAVLNALKSGQLDAGEVSIPLAIEAEAAGYAVHQGTGRAGALYISDHNGEQVPALGDVRVREAIARAFDREAILENVNLGYGQADSEIFQPGTAEYDESRPDPYPYDPDLARELLAEAGYPDGFALTISYLEGEGLNQGSNLAPLVETALGEIGIDVTFVTTPGTNGAEWVEGDAKQNKHPVYLLNIAQTNWIVNFDEIWGPYENDEFADLVAQARGIPGEQAEGFRKIGEFLTDEIWYVVFSKESAAFVSLPEIDVEISGQYPNPKLYQYRPVA